MRFDSETLEHVGWFLVYSFATGLACLLVAMIVRRLAARLSDRVRSGVALLSFVTSTVVPLVAAGWLVGPLPQSPAITLQGGTAVVGEFADLDSVEMAAVPETVELLAEVERGVEAGLPEKPSVSARRRFVSLLPILWLTGAVLTAGMLAFGLVGAVRLRFMSVDVPERIQLLVDDLLKSVPSTRVVVRLSELVRSPILLGIVRPVILLPVTAVGWNADVLRFVILHEIAHAKRRDNLINLIQRVCETICFFQPVVWFTSSWVRTEREVCCDRFVADVTQSPTRYAEVLVHLAAESGSRESRAADLVTCSSTRHALVGRVSRLLGKEETMKLKLRTVLGTTALVFASLFGLNAAAQVQPAGQTDKPTSGTENVVPEEPVQEKPVEALKFSTRSVQVELHDRVVIYAATSGVVSRVDCRLGDSVKKGTRLASLRMQQAKLELRSALEELRGDQERQLARTALDLAQSKLKNAKKKKESFSDAELESLAIELKRAQIEVDRAESRRRIAELKVEAAETAVEAGLFQSPIDGRIAYSGAATGSSVRAGDRLFEITSRKRLRATFQVSVQLAGKLRKGVPVRFEPADEGFPVLSGKVLFVSGETQTVTQLVKVVALLDNPTESVRAGQRGALIVFDDPKQVGNAKQRVLKSLGEATIHQRSSKPVLDNRVRVHLGDITAGQVLVTVRARVKSGDVTSLATLVDEKPMKLGELVTFDLDGTRHAVRIKQLTNVLIGNDFAVVELLNAGRDTSKPAAAGKSVR